MKKISYDSNEGMKPDEMGIYLIEFSVICVRKKYTWNWKHWFGITV